MPRLTLPRLLLVALAAILASVGISSGAALAHNSLISSDPPDGTSLAVAPTGIVWTFDKSVPLETLTVTLIDASGARTEIAGSVHGSSGDAEVVTPLPTLQSGSVSVRWRLVGPDGHPITGRVGFMIGPHATTSAPAVIASGSASSASTTPATTQPSVTAEDSIEAGEDSYSTPSLLRWVLRYGSYLAIMAVVGMLLTSAYVWPGAGTHPLLRRILSRSLAATALLAFVNLLVVASDVGGDPPWTSFESIDAATTTDAGMAFAIRIALAIAMWLVLYQSRLVHPDVYWTAVSLPGLGLLATWAFAGHSRSMRWPAIGVVTDVAHHAAAAAWIAGLAIVGWIVIPSAAPAALVKNVRRFSRLAAASVAILVITGLVQTARLVGNPVRLLDANHGRYLAAKLVVLAVMLGIANVNRRRVDTRLNDPAELHYQLRTLRQAIVAEFVIGLVIIGVTAAMVVSPPSTRESAERDPISQPRLILHSVVFPSKGTTP
jgi:copper transport protein